MDAVFKALADASRRSLLDRLNARNGQTLTELASGLDMSRQSVSKHLAVLEDAELITTMWKGREKLHYLNAAPINAISDRWIRHYDRGRVSALADLKTALEEHVQDSEFVYVTYIAAPAELVWRGITDPAFTRRYWGMSFRTDWNPGSTYTMEHGRTGVEVSDPEMIVKAYEPYEHLAYTWMSYPKELTDGLGFGDDFRRRAAAEARSTVDFTLAPEGDQTKLTVVHSGFAPDSVVFPDISGGWPKVMSWLKTFLESGAYQQAA